MAAKKRALISVSDKRYITNLARDLSKLGFELISTGGTFKKLKEAKVPVKELSRVFKTPEILDGRVKTLHPDVHAAILADRDNPAHVKELHSRKITPFDLVVVNFYPFRETVKVGKTAIMDAIELVDIGGPTMVRAAAKNFKHVAVVSSVDQYRDVIRQLKENDCETTETYRLSLAREAFRNTADYETSVIAYFDAVAPALDDQSEQPTAPRQMQTELLPAKLNLQLRLQDKLRYGENPHQPGARYTTQGLPQLNFKVLQGKDMSFNNYLDASAAVAAVAAEYTEPYTACVVKHLNPCGIAVGDDPMKTFVQAREADPKSAFGGIVGLNYPVDLTLAQELRRTFFEIVIAPGFDKEAREHLASKKNLRLIEADINECRELMAQSPRFVVNLFGVFLQSYDVVQETWDQLQFVSNIQPDETLKEDILLGLTYIRFLKSNSLCIVKNGVMVGRGVGQMSRVDAAELAIKSAGRKCKGAVLVSDGFFPFADSIELASKAKIGCVVAPAGSKRDPEVVSAANKLKMPLVFAPYRHFLH
ncbi:bifunctional phosphoribosylaminoimidazolecarboxamide formyltransferase/IMP cyclohydrolase [bacterium]|nr:bifunctional phosphoribosylaminoimidazolecarboxamide formyltransferase/IMP cyclohydrolase [bacterium]